MVLGLLQFLLSKSHNRYCQEAVNSIKDVERCPTSKSEWERAAYIKNCTELALRQNCVSTNKFKYHCAINGRRNKLVEVCAPERIILGHCVEFNVRGGVIQDQKSALCNKTFPKCDRFYNSTDAYKFPDCYLLVSKNEAIWLITKDTSAKRTTMRTITDESMSSPMIIIVAAMLTVGFIAFLLILILIFKKRRRASGMLDERKEAILDEINIKHDNTDDVQIFEQEDEEQLLNSPYYTDDVEKLKHEDDAQLLNSYNTDDVEKVEQEDEVELLNSQMVCRTSHFKRRFSTDEYPYFNREVHVLTHHGRKRIYSAGF